MPTLTITIPAAHATRINDAISANGFTGFNQDGSIQTKSEFTKAWIINMIKAQVKAHEIKAASISAANNAAQDSDNIILT